MRNTEQYAKILIGVANEFAAQHETKCSLAEAIFEKELFFLFSLAQNKGVTIQDIVVITATALAVLLTKPKRNLPHPDDMIIYVQKELRPDNVCPMSSAQPSRQSLPDTPTDKLLIHPCVAKP